MVVGVVAAGNQLDDNIIDAFVMHSRYVPAMVPPVPAASTRPSTLPPAWLQISGPVPCRVVVHDDDDE